MRNFLLKVLSLSLMLVVALSASAQITNCAAPFDAPGTLSTTMSTVCDDGSVWGPGTLTGYTGAFDRTEYVFADPSNIVTNIDGTAGGPKILEINQTGTFDPSAYGLVDGDQFEVTMLHYQLTDLHGFINELFTGSFLFTSCCALAVTFGGVDACSTYNSVGVFNATDITDMNVWVSTILAFGGVDALDNIIFSFEEINAQAGAPCTDNLPICYATTNAITVDVSCGVTTCSSATPPTNLSAVVGGSSTVLSWDPIAASVACQVKATRTSPPGPSPSQNIFGSEPTSTTIPNSLLGAATTWEYQVRCACNISPIDATGFSVLEPFSIPAPRLGEAVAALDFDFYPNPVVEQINITNAAGISRLEVLDMTGRVVQVINSDPWNLNGLNVSVENLPVGIYMLNAQYTDQTVSKRFNIQ
jgi:hypothetical protein